jgi:hypothetical protein
MAMKILSWIGWISLCIALLIVLFAGISVITGKTMFGFTHLVNFFLTADTFILFAIALFIVVYRCDCKKG